MAKTKRTNNCAFNFCQQLGISVIISALLSLSFVAIVDPYNLYHWLRITGFNSKKTDPSRYLEEIKLSQALYIKPDLLILGNSRAEIGFNPDSKIIQNKGYSAYNLAVRGTSIRTSSQQLDYLLKNNLRPKKILLALDFVDYLSASKSDETSVRHDLETNFPVEQWFWQFDSLFSTISIKDSIVTIANQHDPESPTLTSRGFNPLQEYHALARAEGYNVLFQQRAEENAKTYLKKSVGELNYGDFYYFKHILNLSEKYNFDVIVIIYPYHAQIMTLFDSLNLMPKFNEWKLKILDEIEKADLEPTSHPQVLDFSGFGQHQCEKIPVKGDLKTSTRWYWEAGHFKSTLGEIVIERSLSLFDRQAQSTFENQEFGIILSPENLNSNIRRIAIERENCIASYPELFSSANALIGSLRSKLEK